MRRLHSLSGVVPLGAFLVEHLWATAGVMKSRAAFDSRVLWLDRTKIGLVFEIVLIWIPFAFHALYGVVLAFDRSEKDVDSPYPGRRFGPILRVSGLASLLFIGWHSWGAPLARLFGKVPVDGLLDLVTMQASSTTRGVPWHAIGYFLGLFVTVLHFGYGLVSFVHRRRIAKDDQALRRWTFRITAFSAVLLIAGWATTLSLATGWPKAAEPAAVSSAACPPEHPVTYPTLQKQ
ncbi:MAG TPA: hypothetical protein VF407_03730 [Polyangiaceae bacterium]